MEEKFVIIINEMAEVLNAAQLKRLQEVLVKHLYQEEPLPADTDNLEYLTMFLNAKKIEGCSERTIQYYKVTIQHFLKLITEPIRKITTEQIRQYLVDYQAINNCSKVTVDNIRRNVSSFFSWLEEEDYIQRIVKLSATPLRNRPHMVFCSQGTFWGASSAHGTSVGCNPPAYP